MEQCLINGVVATGIPADDRGLAYGDGLFETIAVRCGLPRGLSLHLDRLQDGCERIGLSFPGRDLLKTEIHGLSLPEHGALKVILTRGSGRRGYAADPAAEPLRVVTVAASEPYPEAFYAQGVALRFCTTPVSSNTALAGLKSLNRLEQVLARSEWSDKAFQEGLMCSGDQRVIAGTMTNLFVVANGRVVTPELSDCGIAGTMRRRIMNVLQANGTAVSEQDLSTADVRNAEELFVTNALLGLWPVARLEAAVFPGAEGRVTQQVMHALHEDGVSDVAPGLRRL